MNASEWQASMAEKCWNHAEWHESEAQRLRALGEKILHPPEGVTVEPGFPPYDVRFVGPTVEAVVVSP